MTELKLCYVDDGTAYFTSLPLTGDGRQWGDDWNDRPHYLNAGDPYISRQGYAPHTLVKLMFSDLDWESPGNAYSHYSVEDMNSGRKWWLKINPYSNASIEVYAGVTVQDFVRVIEMHGGIVWTPLGTSEPLVLSEGG